jgi:hypothetical protein
MPRRASLASKSLELALATPFVVAHRTARMMAAGPRPGPRDRREFHRMVHEKGPAFAAGFLAFAMEGWRLQQALAWQVARTWWSPWLGSGPTRQAWARQVQTGTLRVWDKALAPVHRAAVANARRLGRPR